MKRQTLFRAIVVMAAVLLFAAGLSLAQEGETPAIESLAPAATAGTAFTYQGQLEDGNGPVNASCDFEFALYDAATEGNQVGDIQAKTTTVSDGLFSVALDFGAGAFDGDARWLEIAACCPGTCTPVTLDPRQELTPAPYALYAPPTDIKQLIQDFVVASGESVTAGDVVQFVDGYVLQTTSFGSEYVFEQSSAESISAAVLSSTQFVVAYQDEDNSNYGTAVIGEVSGTTISYGSPYVFNTADTTYISAVALSSNKFVVAYSDWGNSKYGTAVIGEVSGTTITYGSEYVYNSAITAHISAAALSPNQFVVAYKDEGNSHYGTAVIGDISGTTITYGSTNVFNSDVTYYISTAALSSTNFVVAYTDEGNSEYGTTVVGDVSGTTISYGSEYEFNTAITYNISAAVLSSTQFVVAYQDRGNSYYGTAVIGDVSGTTITYGSEYVFNSAGTDNNSVAALSPTQFMIAYRDDGNSEYGTAMIGNVSGTTITYGSENVFNAASTYYISAAAFSPTQFVVAYRDDGNSEYGTAIIYGDQGHTVGIAKESKTAGETVPVIIGGVSDVHSGLTPGEVYYGDTAGGLTTSERIRRIGLAISDTELLLDIDIYGD